MQDEATKLKGQVMELETQLRERDNKLREAEGRVATVEAQTKIIIAESQALAVKEGSSTRAELDDLKVRIALIRGVESQSVEL